MQLLCWFLEVISKALSHLFVLFFPSTKNNLNYQKYPEKDRSKIGKYVSENGSIAGVRKFIQGLTSSLQCNILRFGPKHEKSQKKIKPDPKSFTQKEEWSHFNTLTNNVAHHIETSQLFAF